MSHGNSSLRYWLVVATVVCAVGCRTTERVVEDSNDEAAANDVERVQEIIRTSAIAAQAHAANARLAAADRQAGAYTISLATFIPGNYVLAPAIHPQSFVGPASLSKPLPQRLVFSGDDRAFDVDATRYRAKQIVTLVPDETLDADGLYDDSKLNLGGRTQSFIAKLALADGKLDIADTVGGKGNDIRPLKKEVPVDTSGMLIDDPIRLGPKRVSVRLHTARSGGPRDQLLAGAPSIDWDFTIVIDTSGPTPKYELAGSWDGYPAMEIYINRQPIYQYRGEDRPPTMSDLMKLAPGYGDLKVETSGMLTRTTR